MYFKGKKIKGKIGPSNDLQGYGEEIRALLAERIPMAKDIRVLDVGTGFGGVTEFLARSLSKGSKLWTLDPSKEAIAKVRKDLKVKRLADRIEFIQAGAEKMEFDNGFFDVVVSVMALHHMKDLGPAMREMTRVLKSRGKILLADFLPEAAHELEFKTPHHESDFFTPDEVKAAMRSEGFKTRETALDLCYLTEGRR